jgi:hypothetical protein
MYLDSYRPSGTVDLAGIVEYHARIVCAAKKVRLATDDGRARNNRLSRPVLSPWISSESESEVSIKRAPSPVPPPAPSPPAASTRPRQGPPPPPVCWLPPRERTTVFTAPCLPIPSAAGTALLPPEPVSSSSTGLHCSSPPPAIVEVVGENDKSMNSVRT